MSIKGTVENGARQAAVFDFYQGMVGVRTKGTVIELAYFGPTPRTCPVDGTVGGRPCKVTAFRTANVDGAQRARQPRVMTVLTADWTGAAPAAAEPDGGPAAEPVATQSQ